MSMEIKNEQVRANIRGVIAAYKKDFARINRDERYKWEAIRWYQTHWDIDAADFPQMLTAAFGKAYNLLSSSMYYPYRALQECARVNPEAVRESFRMLYDESQPLELRVINFRAHFKNYIAAFENWKNHYQDLRAVMLYLTFAYPEKYFLFKTRMYTSFRDRIGFVEPVGARSQIRSVENFNRMCELVLSEVRADDELVQMSQARLDENCYSDEALHLLTMDVIYFGSGLPEEPKPFLDEGHSEDLDIDPAPVHTATDLPLNTILYGPPGTGKTYHLPIYAVSIIEDRPVAEVEREEHGEILRRYEAYREQGRVAFTTFHQSYSYEDFIEGIRPVIDEEEAENGSIAYKMQSGVFKSFCDAADLSNRESSEKFGIEKTATIWKVSLGGTGDNPTRTECMQNGHIRIGWDEYGPQITEETDFSRDGGRIVLNAFNNRMQPGDIVLSCYSASAIDAIGVVTGDCEWHDEYDDYKRLRKVNWLAKELREDIRQINGGKSMTLSTVYQMTRISVADVLNILERTQPAQPARRGRHGNCVFIIDEINRGNISKIFGELITLIEPSKRKGAAEAVTVTLPYSQKEFSVPRNVYILGTMNTADRSIAAIDTALRRRFQFREMLPAPELLRGVYVEDVSIEAMLSRMNQRIAVLYDREHAIGHAPFLPLRTSPTVELLGEIFLHSILPLLQEYFYEDYEKIRLVLADNQKDDERLQFITSRDCNPLELFGNPDAGYEAHIYEINRDAFGDIDAYRSI